MAMANTVFKSGGGGGSGISAFDQESISAGGSISSENSGIQYRPIAGNGGAVTASTTPFGSGGEWISSTCIVLRGTSDSNTVTIPNNDAQYGAILNGTAILRNNYVIELIYDALAERWIERGRNF